jgi:hypothetical protein
MKVLPGEDEEHAQRVANDELRGVNWHQQALNLGEKLIIGTSALLYAALLAWPLYGLAIGSGSRQENFTLLGGVIGLMLATYAVMSNRIAEPMRLPLGVIGLSIVLACWGFGSL